jgi:hypothetical protein
LKGGDKAMKKSPWRLSLLLAVVIVALITLGFVYATGDKAQEKEKEAVTSETHGHQEGSAECVEAHKSGKCTGCTGHEQGEHQQSVANSENPGNGPAMSEENQGQGHEEGSRECIEDHKSGECTCTGNCKKK